MAQSIADIVRDRIAQASILNSDQVFSTLADPDFTIDDDDYAVVIVDPDPIRETRESQTLNVDIHVFSQHGSEYADKIMASVRLALHDQDMHLSDENQRRWGLIRLRSEGVAEELVSDKLDSRVERFQVYAVKSD